MRPLLLSIALLHSKPLRASPFSSSLLSPHIVLAPCRATQSRAHFHTLNKAYTTMVQFYDLSADTPKGEPFSFDSLKGKVVLITNTASKCGFTPQLEGLEELYKKYKDQGLVVLGFPCNQFANQEPENDEGIASFCMKNYGVSFPMMAKSDVNGANTNDVFKFLKSEKSGVLGITRIPWNFAKFLVDKNGKVVQRYAPTTKPKDIAAEIEKLLNQPTTVESS